MYILISYTWYLVSNQPRTGSVFIVLKNGSNIRDTSLLRRCFELSFPSCTVILTRYQVLMLVYQQLSSFEIWSVMGHLAFFLSQAVWLLSLQHLSFGQEKMGFIVYLVHISRRPRWLGRLSSCLLKSILWVQFSPSARTGRDFFLHKNWLAESAKAWVSNTRWKSTSSGNNEPYAR